jgi:pheromone shutdown-related protein TraB
VDGLPASVTEVVRGDTTYYVLGTAHVSRQSVEDVRAVIDRVEPSLVAVELCAARYDTLVNDRAFRDLNVIKVVREGRVLYLLGHLALTSYQRRIGASLGVKPGAELLAACEVANAKGIPLALIDRDINITLKRTWRNIGLWRRAMLLSSLIVGSEDPSARAEVTTASVEKLKEPGTLSDMLSELARALPEIKGPLIDERDHYLASKLTEAGAGKPRVVAVVGAAHVPGMVATFDQVVDRAALDKVPPPSLVWLAIKWLVPLLLLAAIIWGWHRSETTSLWRMVLAWIIPTAIGAGLFTLVAGASIFTVLAAIGVSPLAAIHPLLGAKIVVMAVGIVEAWRRHPSVADCERLPEDIQSFRGFWRNPVTRILLIAVASGIGTAIGFAIGVGWVASLL